MNILFLRGLFPKDRENPKEILYDSIEAETDYYTELAYAITGPDDRCTVLYGGYKRTVKYAENFEVKFVKRLKDYEPSVKPDLIIARGGFPEYLPILKKYHWATKVYYGAGKRFIPEASFLDYDVVLVDSQRQKDALHNLYPHMNAQLWFKGPSHIFRPVDVEKKYDVCFVAIHPKDTRKRVNWVWDTVPRDISVLQLGNPMKGRKPPKNVTIKHVSREKMPKAMSKCCIGIAPYNKDDSCPRVVPEFLACGLPVVARDSLQIWNDKYGISLMPKDKFWKVAMAVLPVYRHLGALDLDERCTMPLAAKHLLNLIRSLEHE